MAKTSGQKLKILYLMKILLENTDSTHAMTLNEIAASLEKYGVVAERKSLYDDMETLRVYGLDIETRRDTHVRYYVASRQFELPELKLLVDAVQSSKFITAKKSGELIKKLESFASVYEAMQLQRQVYVSNRIKTMNESIYYNVDFINSGITENRRITFKYYDWTPQKEKKLRHDGKVYSVSPWALTWDDENYYMIAYDGTEQKIKHYRVDKMLEINITDIPREGGEMFSDFDMAIYSKEVFGMYGGESAVVVLECDNSLAGVIIDRFGTDVSMFPGADGFRASVRVMVSPTFISWLIGFGSKMKVISPQWVVDSVRGTLSEVAGLYDR
ncbi:MAG: helix-turn-helix transcriptional regulator [Eubacteriales bacterium]